jgi:glyoxylase-like metal-dependent hydrolase (beta-lactamase superfamily II)
MAKPKIDKSMKIKFLNAFNGDAILLSFKDGNNNRNILIDSGMPATYIGKDKKKGKQKPGELMDVVKDIKNKGEKIDLLVMTHVDDDHIGGVLNWFKKDNHATELINEVWFNSGRLIGDYSIYGHLLSANARLDYASNCSLHFA